MSDFFRKLRLNPDRSPARGFTLLEILVVLALVGVMAAFSLPQFSMIRDRVTFTLNRDSFEREIAGLSYLAFKEGRTLMLAGQYPRASNDQKTPAERLQEADEGILSREPGQLRPLQPAGIADAMPTLPEDWRMTVDRPIIYTAAGFCGGGTVKLVIGQTSYAYDLKAPTCQALLEQ